MVIHGVDLVRLVEQDLGVGKRSGKWVLFRCPFHDDHNPSLAVINGDGQQQRGPYFKCFAGSCGKHGGAVRWLMEYRKMDYQEAVRLLEGGASLAPRPGEVGRYDPVPLPYYPPGGEWQRRAMELIERAQAVLWREDQEMEWEERDPESGEASTRKASALEWLLSRGLTVETLRLWRVGYIPIDWADQGDCWGMPGKRVCVPSGILLPCVVDDLVWYLKIRRPAGKPKYLNIPGGKSGLYLVQSLEWMDTVVFCEGEFDALLLWQEAGGLAGVTTLGGASNPLNVATWGLYLLNIRRKFTAYDADAAGAKGAELLEWLHPVRLKVPKLRPFDKDLKDFYRSGGDLKAWLSEELVKG